MGSTGDAITRFDEAAERAGRALANLERTAQRAAEEIRQRLSKEEPCT